MGRASPIRTAGWRMTGAQETLAWVKAENRVTSQYLSQIPFRKERRSRLDQLQNYVRYTPPVLRGGWYFFRKNDGLQNQNVVYVQQGLNGTPKILLDPNKFSKDGTSRLGLFAVSKDGTYAAYTISTGGSDWQEGHVLEVASGKVLSDKLQWLESRCARVGGRRIFLQPLSGAAARP